MSKQLSQIPVFDQLIQDIKCLDEKLYLRKKLLSFFDNLKHLIIKQGGSQYDEVCQLLNQCKEVTALLSKSSIKFGNSISTFSHQSKLFCNLNSLLEKCENPGLKEISNQREEKIQTKILQTIQEIETQKQFRECKKMADRLNNSIVKLDNELLYLFLVKYIFYDQPIPMNYFVKEFTAFVNDFDLIEIDQSQLKNWLEHEINLEQKNVIELKKIRTFFEDWVGIYNFEGQYNNVSLPILNQQSYPKKTMKLNIHYPQEAKIEDQQFEITSDDLLNGNLCFGRQDNQFKNFLTVNTNYSQMNKISRKQFQIVMSKGTFGIICTGSNPTLKKINQNKQLLSKNLLFQLGNDSMFAVLKLIAADRPQGNQKFDQQYINSKNAVQNQEKDQTKQIQATDKIYVQLKGQTIGQNQINPNNIYVNEKEKSCNKTLVQDNINQEYIIINGDGTICNTQIPSNQVQIHNTEQTIQATQISPNQVQTHNIEKTIQAGQISPNQIQTHNIEKTIQAGQISPNQVQTHNIEKTIQAGQISPNQIQTHNIEKTIQAGQISPNQVQTHNIEKTIQAGQISPNQIQTHNIEKTIQAGQISPNQVQTHNTEKTIQTAQISPNQVQIHNTEQTIQAGQISPNQVQFHTPVKTIQNPQISQNQVVMNEGIIKQQMIDSNFNKMNQTMQAHQISPNNVQTGAIQTENYQIIEQDKVQMMQIDNQMVNQQQIAVYTGYEQGPVSQLTLEFYYPNKNWKKETLSCQNDKSSWKFKEESPFTMQQIKDVAANHATIFYEQGLWNLSRNDQHNYPIFICLKNYDQYINQKISNIQELKEGDIIYIEKIEVQVQSITN